MFGNGSSTEDEIIIFNNIQRQSMLKVYVLFSLRVHCTLTKHFILGRYSDKMCSYSNIFGRNLCIFHMNLLGV